MSENVVDLILKKGRDIPYNIQRIAHNVWEEASESKKAGNASVDKAIETIVNQESLNYEALWDGLSQQPPPSGLVKFNM